MATNQTAPMEKKDRTTLWTILGLLAAFIVIYAAYAAYQRPVNEMRQDAPSGYSTGATGNEGRSATPQTNP